MNGQKLVPTYGARPLAACRASDPARGSFTPKPLRKSDPRSRRRNPKR